MFCDREVVIDIFPSDWLLYPDLSEQLYPVPVLNVSPCAHPMKRLVFLLLFF
jgi:hypothetical protein